MNGMVILVRPVVDVGSKVVTVVACACFHCSNGLHVYSWFISITILSIISLG